MPTPPSENAMAVAREVIDTVRKGKKVNKGDIILKHGYSESISTAPTKVTETKSYKSVTIPFTEELVNERNRAIKAMKNKNLDGVAYDKLSKVIDELTKNIQLLSGKETERTKATIVFDESFNKRNESTEKGENKSV